MTSKQQCLIEADNLERHAKDCLDTWIILGEATKYHDYIDKAYKWRKAADMKTVERNYYIKEQGLLK